MEEVKVVQFSFENMEGFKRFDEKTYGKLYTLDCYKNNQQLLLLVIHGNYSKSKKYQLYFAKKGELVIVHANETSHEETGKWVFIAEEENKRKDAVVYEGTANTITACISSKGGCWQSAGIVGFIGHGESFKETGKKVTTIKTLKKEGWETVEIPTGIELCDLWEVEL